MSGRFGKCDPDKKPDAKHPISKDGARKPAPPPHPDDDEEDGDIATPKRDRDDEADL